MKREEKNQLSRRKILESAAREFAEQGYGLSSVNTICAAGGISKGILYHYFQDKDELYLACLRECFDALTAALEPCAADAQGAAQSCLERYFDARQVFFQAHPRFLRLFCGAVSTPPPHLAGAIAEIRSGFDALNISILTSLLGKVALRADTTVDEVVEVFRLYQDFVNARCQLPADTAEELERREKLCRRSLEVLLYGVAERGAER